MAIFYKFQLVFASIDIKQTVDRVFVELLSGFSVSGSLLWRMLCIEIEIRIGTEDEYDRDF